MPIKVKQNLPARDILENENIFVMTDTRAMTQDIRPLKVLVYANKDCNRNSDS